MDDIQFSDAGIAKYQATWSMMDDAGDYTSQELQSVVI